MSKPTYEYLEAQVKQLEADNEKAMSVLKEANDAVLLAKSKFDALAAENAGMKDINAWCKTDAFKNMYREFKTAEALGCSGVDCMHDAMLAALMHAPETPVTDAFLAEVQAHAIRDALDESSDYLDTDCVMDRLDISYEDAELRTSGAIELHDALVAVANQLRKGE